VRRVAYGWSTITCYLAVATRHHQISAIPRIQIAVSQFSFSSEIQQGLCVSHIVISPTCHPAHVKTEHKGAAAPPLSLHTHPLPRVLYFCIMSEWTWIFLFFLPSASSFFMFAKRLWFFGNNVSGIKTARVFSSFKEDG
jgi:hypothetical protein